MQNLERKTVMSGTPRMKTVGSRTDHVVRKTRNKKVWKRIRMVVKCKRWNDCGKGGWVQWRVQSHSRKMSVGSRLTDKSIRKEGSNFWNQRRTLVLITGTGYPFSHRIFMLWKSKAGSANTGGQKEITSMCRKWKENQCTKYSEISSFSQKNRIYL